MKTNSIRKMFSFAILTIIFLFFQSAKTADLVAEIQVSPNVLNISSMGTVVTIHTNLPYSLVAGATVSLNDVPIDWWKSDDRGYFVAKFDMLTVKKSAGLVLNEYNTFTLVGEMKGGEPFEGSSDILVIKKR